MSLRRRASLSGFEMTSNDLMKPAKGDKFRRRMSLASLGTRKYGRSEDSYCEGGGEEGRQVERKVTVRHVPIVIEGSEGDCKMKTEKERKLKTSQSKNKLSFSNFSQAWNIPDDLSSLSSLSSENSLDSISRLDKIEEVVKAWMIRNGDKVSIGMNENLERKNVPSKEVATFRPSDLKRKPFSDISQNRAIPSQRKAPIKSRVPDAQYMNKTDTSLSNCPVHKQVPNEFGRKESNTDNTLRALKTPSLIQRNSIRTKNTDTSINQSKVDTGKPKHVTNVHITKAKENKAANTPELKTFSRGPGQWSFKGSKSKIKDNENKSVDDQNQAKTHNSKTTFQRSFSFRKPSSSSSVNVQAATWPSQSRLTVLGMKSGSEGNNKQPTPMKKYSSQNDLNVASKTRTQSKVARMTPSVSTSSIPSMVSKESGEVPRSKPPCVGILKTPGKRKISLNNRVEFLNNVREREIPGRHA